MRLSAEDWDLYTSSMKCGAAARAMTKQLNMYLGQAKKDIRKGENSEVVATSVRNNMYAFMSQYSKFGARDTEPEWVLVDAINSELKTKIGRW